jgi:hypothetical protein
MRKDISETAEPSVSKARLSELTRLLAAARSYRLEVPIEAYSEDERSAARELDAALAAFTAFCPSHGGYDPDQRGPGWCPYCVALYTRGSAAAQESPSPASSEEGDDALDL